MAILFFILTFISLISAILYSCFGKSDFDLGIIGVFLQITTGM
jgi:hypothetical protein